MVLEAKMIFALQRDTIWISYYQLLNEMGESN